MNGQQHTGGQPTSKEWFYAVRKGRKTGIYCTWKECEEQVKGFSKADFKKFSTLEEAESFITGPNEDNLPKNESASGSVAVSSDSVAVPDNSVAVSGDSIAVSDDSVGSSLIDTNAGIQSSSPQVLEQHQSEEPMPSDYVVQKYHVNETGSRGVALIINNVYRKEGNDRKLSEEDAKRLKEVLEDLGYEVEIHETLKANEIEAKVSEIAANSVKEMHDSFICCLLSHGNTKGIEGVDEIPVTVTELANIVNSKKCKALYGKPKLFFFQACRRTEIPKSATVDSPGLRFLNKKEEIADGTDKALPRDADFLFGFSTSDGNVSGRSYTGSPYIQALCKFIPSGLSLDELLLLVNYEVSKNQIPEIRSTLRKKFYFKK